MDQAVIVNVPCCRPVFFENFDRVRLLHVNQEVQRLGEALVTRGAEQRYAQVSLFHAW